MTDWQLTAKTIFCDAVGDEVTIMVRRNGSTTCTGCKKYSRPDAVTRRIIARRVARLKRPVKCEGEPCARTTRYTQKIMAEEAE